MASLGGIFDNGVSAMMAQSIAMSSVSDNIANISTIGFKRTDTQFSTLLGEHDTAGNTTKTPISDQNGVNATTRQLVNVDGSIHTTGNQFDLAISGPGMFAFADPNNTSNVVYGRAGSLQATVPTLANSSGSLTSNAAYLANGNGQFLLGYQATPVPPGAPTGTQPTLGTTLVPIQVSSQTPFPGQVTGAASLSAVIPASGATSVSAPLSYIDSAGVPQTLSLTFSNPTVVGTGGVSTTWNVSVADANGNPVTTSPATMSFDQTGNAIAPASFAISATSTSVTAPAAAPTTSFSLDLSHVQMLGTATTASNGSALAVNTNYTQDGLPAGAFNGVQVNPDGSVIGSYTGGATQILYRIPVAQFVSPNNLQALSGNVYAPTQGSGSATFLLPGSGTPNLNVGAVEESNVDLGQSFTTMILTQQAYSSAAQVVQVANQMSSITAGLQT